MKLSEHNSLSDINPIQDYVNGSSINKVKEGILTKQNMIQLQFHADFFEFHGKITNFDV